MEGIDRAFHPEASSGQVPAKINKKYTDEISLLSYYGFGPVVIG